VAPREDLLSEIVTALITLCGTLAVAGLGFWQWQRTQRRDRGAVYHEQRVSALRSVWAQLADIEATQRSAVAGDREELRRQHIRESNLLLLRSAPFLFVDEREWAVSIVELVVELDSLLRSQPDLQGSDDWWEMTGAPPIGATLASVAATRLGEAKEEFGERYAAVMRGDHE
jgi:hypothetical protein